MLCVFLFPVPTKKSLCSGMNSRSCVIIITDHRSGPNYRHYGDWRILLSLTRHQEGFPIKRVSLERQGVFLFRLRWIFRSLSWRRMALYGTLSNVRFPVGPVEALA